MDTLKFDEQSISQHLHLNMLKRNWEEALHDQSFVMESAITLFISFTIIYFLPEFFQRIQMRTGMALYDPVLNIIPAIDVSGYLFMLLYTCVILAMGYMLYFPRQFIWGVQAYCLLTLMRGACVYFIPLEPPSELVPLVDPVLTHLFYKSPSITKDLFFSGHTATLFMISLVVHHKGLKLFYTLATILIGTLVMIQHIHYSYDVFAAPFFAWLAVFAMQNAGRLRRMLVARFAKA